MPGEYLEICGELFNYNSQLCVFMVEASVCFDQFFDFLFQIIYFKKHLFILYWPINIDGNFYWHLDWYFDWNFMRNFHFSLDLDRNFNSPFDFIRPINIDRLINVDWFFYNSRLICFYILWNLDNLLNNPFRTGDIFGHFNDNFNWFLNNNLLYNLFRFMGH